MLIDTLICIVFKIRSIQCTQFFQYVAPIHSHLSHMHRKRPIELNLLKEKTNRSEMRC